VVVLVPWKPIGFVWLLLSAIIWLGCLAQLLMDGQNPFLPRGFYIDPVDHMGHIANHRRFTHRPA